MKKKRKKKEKKKKKKTEGCHKAIGERSEREIRASGASCVFVVRVRHSACCWLASLQRCFAPGIVILLYFCVVLRTGFRSRRVCSSHDTKPAGLRVGASVRGDCCCCFALAGRLGL